jgi:hypothetical protein
MPFCLEAFSKYISEEFYPDGYDLVRHYSVEYHSAECHPGEAHSDRCCDTHKHVYNKYILT